MATQLAPGPAGPRRWSLTGTLTAAGLVQAAAQARGGNGGSFGGDLRAAQHRSRFSAVLTLEGCTSAPMRAGSVMGPAGLALWPAGMPKAEIRRSSLRPGRAWRRSPARRRFPRMRQEAIRSAGTGGSAQAGDAHVKAHDGTHLSINNLTLSADGTSAGTGSTAAMDRVALSKPSPSSRTRF